MGISGDTIKARVFLSCGQRYKDEIHAAERIKKMLEKQNYMVYLATEQHSLESLKENILNAIENSEYFLFVDFKREELRQNKKGIKRPDTKSHRGSIYTNQELAVAIYLEVSTIAFQEKGVEPHKGMLDYVIANPETFKNEEELISKIEKRMEIEKWRTDWRNNLSLSVVPNPTSTKRIGEEERPACWYHINVTNNHNKKQANNVTAFILDLKDSTGNEMPLEPTELKWKGTTTQQVIIPPKNSRKIDIFHIFQDKLQEIKLGINPFTVDSTAQDDAYTLKRKGTYEMTVVVYSDNFNRVKETYLLEIDATGRFKSFYRMNHKGSFTDKSCFEKDANGDFEVQNLSTSGKNRGHSSTMAQNAGTMSPMARGPNQGTKTGTIETISDKEETYY